MQKKIEEKYISPIVESRLLAIKNKYLDKFSLKEELSELEELIELTRKRLLLQVRNAKNSLRKTLRTSYLH